MPKSFNSETSISLETSPPLFIIKVKSWCFFLCLPCQFMSALAFHSLPCGTTVQDIFWSLTRQRLYACDRPNKRPSPPPLSSPVLPSRSHVGVLSSLKQPFLLFLLFSRLPDFIPSPPLSSLLVFSFLLSNLSRLHSFLLTPPEDFHLVFAAAPVAPNPWVWESSSKQTVVLVSMVRLVSGTPTASLTVASQSEKPCVCVCLWQLEKTLSKVTLYKLAVCVVSH